MSQAEPEAPAVTPESPAPEPPAPARPPWSGWDPLIRVGGVLIAVLAAFVTGVLELLLTTLRAGDLTTIWRGEPIGSGRRPGDRAVHPCWPWWPTTASPGSR